MILDQLKSIFKNKLKNSYSQIEIFHLFSIFSQEILKISKNTILTEPDFFIPDNKIDEFYVVLKKLTDFEPVQYIIGKTEFYNLQFLVDKNVLIPRPETEEIVDIILKTENLDQKKILDIGTGSGCIAISLKKNSNAEVFATDISENVIITAKKNALLNSVDINFIQHDILSAKNILFNQIELNFDIIISNPPYVRNSEKKLMKSNVLNFEPSLALYVSDEKPLLFYEAIKNFALSSLKKNGMIYLEINEFLSEQTANLFRNKEFSSVEIKKDLSNKNRFLRIKK
ncbi:MAG: peptide chain release factor N(5)-glutamine methyltransferase [Bacteroidales bacterium]|nr:peptide chain release factor N(5)-glutamine methyltransferase [Bacteroidales bacterium]